MTKSTIKYKYAFDANSNNKIVCIDEVIDENLKGHKFLCISCGQELIPVLGEKRVKHFRHKTDVECDGETYLHQLAKLKLKDKFDNKSIPFYVKFYQTIVCQKMNNCEFRNESYNEGQECKEKQETVIDLHKYYDTCSIEKAVYIDTSKEKKCVSNIKAEDCHEKFIPDLLLSDSNNPQKQPIFIEIWNKHKSESKKINSSVRIIEIRVHNENNIEALINDSIEETWTYEKNNKDYYQAYFYNFKERTGIINCQQIVRFFYYKTGASYVDFNNGEGFLCECLHKKINPQKTIAELNMTNKLDNLYASGLIYLRNQGHDIKNCILCKYYNTNLFSMYSECRLHQKFQTPLFPKQFEARTCQYYREDRQFIYTIQQELKNAKIVEVQ